MLVSCPVEVLDSRLGGVDKAIELLAEAGFDAYDISLCTVARDECKDHWLNLDNWREEVARLKALADKAGIVCNQSHAPFPSSVGDAEKDEYIFDRIVRSMEAAALLGAKIIVVHPKQHLKYAEHAAELREMNIEFYKRLVPYCEKFGIKVATENMWQYNSLAKQPIDSTCSRAPEFCDYIDSVGSEWIVGCLDVGHTLLVSADNGDFIRRMGKDRLKALHVHDVTYSNDAHTLPYLLNNDFKKITDALYEIGYDGDMTFEAGAFFRKFPDSLLPACARFMCEVGRQLAAAAQGK